MFSKPRGMFADDESLREAAHLDYEESHAELCRLLDLDPPNGTPERERMEVLTARITAYDLALCPDDTDD